MFLLRYKFFFTIMSPEARISKSTSYYGVDSLCSLFVRLFPDTLISLFPRNQEKSISSLFHHEYSPKVVGQAEVVLWSSEKVYICIPTSRNALKPRFKPKKSHSKVANNPTNQEVVNIDPKAFSLSFCLKKYIIKTAIKNKCKCWSHYTFAQIKYSIIASKLKPITKFDNKIKVHITNHKN